MEGWDKSHNPCSSETFSQTHRWYDNTLWISYLRGPNIVMPGGFTEVSIPYIEKYLLRLDGALPPAYANNVVAINLLPQTFALR